MSKTRHRMQQGDEHLLVRTYAVTHPRNVGLPARAHDGWDQLAFASRGVMTVITAAGAWVVPPQRAVWIPAGHTFTVRTSGRVSLRTLLLRPALSRGRLPRQCVALNVSPLVRELVLHITSRNTLRRDLPADRRLAQTAVDQLTTLPHEPLQLPTPDDARAQRAATLAQSEPTLSTRRLARAAGASARTLERAFLRDTGMSLGRWRRRARLIAALRRLADGASVTSAGLDVGYRTPSAFIAAFRREMGTTPGRYFTRG